VPAELRARLKVKATTIEFLYVPQEVKGNQGLQLCQSKAAREGFNNAVFVNPARYQQGLSAKS
jgi:hypothetical protein